MPTLVEEIVVFEPGTKVRYLHISLFSIQTSSKAASTEYCTETIDPISGAEDAGRPQLDGIVAQVGHPDAKRGDGHPALEMRRRRHLCEMRRPP